MIKLISRITSLQPKINSDTAQSLLRKNIYCDALLRLIGSNEKQHTDRGKDRWQFHLN